MRSSAVKDMWQKGMGGLILAAYAFFCYLMAGISAQYVSLAPDVAFLGIKQDYVHLGYYRLAFFVHAFTALLALPAGFTQFSGFLRKKYPLLHRRAGYLYVGVILLLAAPSGLVIGIFANGGWSSQLAFCLLAVLWFVSTLQALRYARKRNWRLHRDFMYRSFALTLSAITLRAWKYALVALFHPPPMEVYRLVAWLGWGLNLALVEIWIWKNSGRAGSLFVWFGKKA